MLVCAKCEFENPEDNRFCQNCGHPLRLVSAIIMWQTPTDADGASSSSDEASSTDADLKGEFLDPAHRYQFQPSLVELPSAPGEELEVEVTDAYPGDPSPLDSLQTELIDAETSAESIEAILFEQLPAVAHPYLKLQNQLFPVLPELYAAWQAGDYGVVVLENRTHLPLLHDIWRDQALDPLQQVHWFFEMTDLWHALEPWQGQASLLERNNLCVDEDQILCLRRLYCQPTPNADHLTDLGLLWEVLLQTLPNTLEPLKQLAHDVADGQIDQLKSLQNRLAQIADALQTQSESELALESDPISSIEDEVTDDAPEADVQLDLDAEAGLSKPLDVRDKDRLGVDVTAEDAADEADLEALLGDTEATVPTLLDVVPNLLGADGDPDSAVQEEEDDAEFAESTMVLPMMLVGLEEAGQTHVGQQRDHNEDSFYIRTELCKQEIPSGRKLAAKGLYILCDGMGGHDGGEVASDLAVKTLQAYFEQHWHDDLPPEESIQSAIAEANHAIYDLNIQDERSGSGRMGTTLIMVLLQDTQAVVAHVGDSRLYRYSRRLGLQQVTTDHEVGQREIKRGVEPAIAYARPDAYQLTQALGPRDSEDIRPSVTYLDLNEDTLFILCSDGLSDNDLVETYCTSYVEPLLRSRHDLEEGVAELIELANVHNGHDNITVIAVRVKVRPNLERLHR